MDNRTKILSTSLELFARNGYDAVGVQEIVSSSAVTKPTLYHYFGSKRGLLDALLEENFGLLCDDIKEAAVYQHDLQMNLFNLVRTFFTYASRNREFYRLQLSMCFSSPESETYNAVSGYNKKIIAMLDEMFLKASKDHGNMKGREKQYAFSFLGIINNYITLYLGNHIILDDEAARRAVRQFSYGIYS